MSGEDVQSLGLAESPRTGTGGSSQEQPPAQVPKDPGLGGLGAIPVCELERNAPG